MLLACTFHFFSHKLFHGFKWFIWYSILKLKNIKHVSFYILNLTFLNNVSVNHLKCTNNNIRLGFPIQLNSFVQPLRSKLWKLKLLHFRGNNYFLLCILSINFKSHTMQCIKNEVSKNKKIRYSFLLFYFLYYLFSKKQNTFKLFLTTLYLISK